MCSVYKECGQTDKQGDSYIPPKMLCLQGEGGLTSLFSYLLFYTDLTEPLCNLYNKNELLIFNILQIKSIHYIIVTSMCLVYSRLCHLSLVRSKPSLASHPTQPATLQNLLCSIRHIVSISTIYFYTLISFFHSSIACTMIPAI